MQKILKNKLILLIVLATALLWGNICTAKNAAAQINDTPATEHIKKAYKPEKNYQASPQPLPTTAAYMQRIEAIEADSGAYGAGMDEQLLGLGSALQKMGDHEEAIRQFRRAMLINRVHEGLYSLNQAPMIRRIIDSQISLNQWEDANNNQQYLFWLHARNYGKKDPRMLPVIDALSNWHLQAYIDEKGATLSEHLIHATNFYSMAVDIISQNFGVNDLRLVKALRGLKATNYYLATYAGEPQPPIAMNTRFGSVHNDPMTQQNTKLDQYRLKSFASGKNAISRIVKVYQTNPNSPPAASAKAKVEMGDWHMLFGKWNSAKKIYSDAYQALWDNGATNKEIEAIFGRPASLPSLPLIDYEQEGTVENYVTVSYDVTEFGKARNIKIIDASVNNKVTMGTRVRKTLKRAKFRPRFDNAKPVGTTGIVQRFVFD